MNATSPLNYTVIINPDSGPGNGSKPNDDFLPAIQRLNTYPNARTVGYVPTNYGKRPIDEVIQDVSTYSGWATNATGIAMHGIFFDEAPHEYSADVADYMRRANDAVLSANGIQGNKTVCRLMKPFCVMGAVANSLIQIIHNPGTIPDQGLGLNSTDITVVFEQSYNKFKSQQSALSDLSGARSSYSYMVHSVPSSTNLGDLIDTMSQHAQYLFVTNRDSAYYEGFGSDWRDFVSMVPT